MCMYTQPHPQNRKKPLSPMSSRPSKRKPTFAGSNASASKYAPTICRPSPSYPELTLELPPPSFRGDGDGEQRSSAANSPRTKPWVRPAPVFFVGLGWIGLLLFMRLGLRGWVGVVGVSRLAHASTVKYRRKAAHNKRIYQPKNIHMYTYINMEQARSDGPSGCVRAARQK